MRHSTLLSLVGAYFGAGADWEGHEVLCVAFIASTIVGLGGLVKWGPYREHVVMNTRRVVVWSSVIDCGPVKGCMDQCLEEETTNR
jgi:hypothetical protein